MSTDPYIGSISMFAGNFAPHGWALCEGQFMPIPNNPALFSLLGTTFGGDGRQDFKLPDFRGRIPLGVGTGMGLTPRRWGETGGIEEVTLQPVQIPSHNHRFNLSEKPGTTTSGDGAFLVHDPDGNNNFTTVAPAGKAFNSATLSHTGGSQPHNNMQPFLAVVFCISLMGAFPQRA